MEGLQTTGADESCIDLGVFSESETGDEVKDSNKKDRKELFQINTHPATVVAANNKRDRRLKQIVMRVVAFCKKEHEEGQQIPFRFFKKRASLMTGVSLSTIHRIETIDMKPPPSPKPSESSSGKAKPKKDGQKKAKKKKKKKKEEASQEAVHVNVVPAPLVQQHHLADGSQNVNNQHIHFQVPAASNLNSAAAPAKPAKKKKKKAKNEEDSSGVVTLHNPNPNPNNNNNINNNTATTAAAIITSDLTLQPTVAVHAVNTMGEGMVTTINVHNAMGNPAAVQQRAAAPCTWAAGALAPFAMGDLRDGHQVQLPATASHLQVNAQHVQAVGSAIPMNAQLQPIHVAAVSQQAGFGGQMDGGQVNWAAAGGMGTAFGSLPTTATLVGQQVLQTYPNPGNNPAPGHTLTATPQQQPQHSPVFYQF